MDGVGDDTPISIDAAEHNHLQLLLYINELKEHNGRSESLLSSVAHYIKEQVGLWRISQRTTRPATHFDTIQHHLH
jgi:hypothetical protein